MIDNKLKESSIINKEKILSIQYLRGLAAIGVVFCHYSISLNFPKPIKELFNFGQNGVHVFFLISGFIIAYSLDASKYEIKNFFQFLFKRSIRIDPPYYVVIILCIVIFNYIAYVSPNKSDFPIFNPLQFLAHIFYLIPFTKYPFYTNIFWTLCIEFQFYIIIGLIYFFSKSTYYKKIFLVIFSLSAFIPFTNDYSLVFTYAPIFALGISITQIYNNKNLLNYCIIFFLILVVKEKFNTSITILLTLSSIAILYFKYAVKPLEFLGNISYSLYLTHTLTYMLMEILASKLGLSFYDAPLLFFTITLFISLLIATAFYALIEKPSITLSKKIFYSKKKLSLQVK